MLNRLVRQTKVNNTLNIFSDSTERQTFSLMEQILNNEMITDIDDNLLNNMILNQASYDTSAKKLLNMVNSPTRKINTKSIRIVLSLPDGTLIFDSKVGANNTWQNYLDKKIGENHNTRIAIIAAQLFYPGVGYEKKYSTTTKNFEYYIAKRVGALGDNLGTVRYSIVQ
jgi:hypothetical protein